MELVSTAQKVRWFGVDTVEEAVGPGGLLARTLEVQGEGVLWGLLKPGVQSVELEDGELFLRVERQERGARIVSRWDTGETVEGFLEEPEAKIGRAHV